MRSRYARFVWTAMLAALVVLALRLEDHRALDARTLDLGSFLPIAIIIAVVAALLVHRAHRLHP